MLIDRKNLAVAECAAKVPGRYAMNGIHFTKDGTVGTDGRALAVVPYPDQGCAGDFPELPDFKDQGTPAELTPFIVETKAIKAALGKDDRKNRRPILDMVSLNVEETNANGHAAFGYTDLETASTPKIRKLEGEFPRWQAIVPKAENYPAVRLSLFVLERVLDFLAATGAQDAIFRISKDSACKAETDCPQARGAFAIFMPMAMAKD